jgi:hypothetical protein
MIVTYREQVARYFTQASALGLSYTDADNLRRDAQRLHTWSEHECNGVVERVEDDGRTDHRGRPMVKGATYSVYNINGPGPLHYSRTPDRETGCLNRIRAIAAEYGAEFEYQGDPRGWPVTLKLKGAELSPPVRP